MKNHWLPESPFALKEIIHHLDETITVSFKSGFSITFEMVGDRYVRYQVEKNMKYLVEFVVATMIAKAKFSIMRNTNKFHAGIRYNYSVLQKWGITLEQIPDFVGINIIRKAIGEECR